MIRILSGAFADLYFKNKCFGNVLNVLHAHDDVTVQFRFILLSTNKIISPEGR